MCIPIELVVRAKELRTVKRNREIVDRTRWFQLCTQHNSNTTVLEFSILELGKPSITTASCCPVYSILFCELVQLARDARPLRGTICEFDEPNTIIKECNELGMPLFQRFLTIF